MAHYGESNWMKTKEAKKYFSTLFKGENNPNSKKNTTKKQRQSISPFSIEFYKRKYPNLTFKKQKELLDKCIKKSIKNTITTTNLKWWINKGYSFNEAKEKLKERQDTSSLNSFVRRYGEKEGVKRWERRTEKWLKSFKKNNFSKISQELFWNIYEKINNKENIYFATLKDNKIDNSGKNNEYRLKLKKNYILPDFIDLNQKKIIEFDGDYWHLNSLKDKERDKQIEECGFKILHIKESNYRKNSKYETEKSINFLIGKNK